MGMFDYFYSSYDLGDFFTNVQCQTKDFDDMGSGGSMSQYWLDPAGQLFYVDQSGTRELVELAAEEVNESKTVSFSNFKIAPTGKHGRVKPCLITKYVEIYPQSWKQPYHLMPRMWLHFRKGIFIDCEIVSPLYDFPHAFLEK